MVYLYILFLFSLALFSQETKVDSPKSNTAILAFTGDLMCHSPLYEYAKTEGGYDFTPYFQYIRDELSYADLTIGNLETVLGGRELKYSGYPRFNSPDEYALALKQAGFDFLVTANNHSLDRGEKGLLRTLDFLRVNGIGSTGTFSGKQDRDSIRIITVNDISFALLNYTYGTNGIPVFKGKGYIINLIEKTLIQKDIRTAKELKADVIIVVFHYGKEYKREPDNYQKMVNDWVWEAGGDVIVGSHPHVLQPAEVMTDSLKNLTRFTAHSLGNFISNQQWRYSDAGAVLYLTFEKTAGKPVLKKTDFLPTWVFKGTIEGRQTYRILPSTASGCEHQYDFLSQSQRDTFRKSYDDSKGILTGFNSEIGVFPLLNCRH